MSGSETETKESEWTTENLQKLFGAMKGSIPKQGRRYSYTHGLKVMDWKRVAFPPFTPEACQEKWEEILQKMRKTRTLTELITEAEDAISNPVENWKMHPDLPKRPCPPNAIFYEENCAKLQKKHPNMKGTNMWKLLSKNYKVLPKEEKAQYEEKYQLALAEYNRNMESFRKRCRRPIQKKHRNKRKREEVSVESPESTWSTEDTDGLPPKPPVSGYHLFCKEQLSSTMGNGSKDCVLAVWARRWRALSESQRDEYSARYRELKRQYSVELNDYLMTLDKDEQQQILHKHGIKKPKIIKKRVKPVKRLPDEPKMPPTARYRIFLKDQMECLKNKFPNSKERLIKVSQIWKDLSNEDKEAYGEKANEKMRKYTVELQKWFQKLRTEEQEDYLKQNPSKCKYLDAHKMKQQKEALYRPSDSEDEDIQDSSSDEEHNNLDCEEDEEEEEEEEGEDLMFKIY